MDLIQNLKELKALIAYKALDYSKEEEIVKLPKKGIIK